MVIKERLWSFLVYPKERRRLFIAACLLLLAGYLAGYVLPRTFQSRLIMLFISKMDSLGPVSAPVLFLNNLQAGLFMLAGGLVFLLPPASLFINGLIIGAMFSIMMPMTGFWPLAVSILPHGVLELPAICLAAALGMSISARLAGFYKQTDIFNTVTRAVGAFVLLVIPLLAAASLIEIYITGPVASSVLTLEEKLDTQAEERALYSNGYSPSAGNARFPDGLYDRLLVTGLKMPFLKSFTNGAGINISLAFTAHDKTAALAAQYLESIKTNRDGQAFLSNGIWLKRAEPLRYAFVYGQESGLKTAVRALGSEGYKPLPPGALHE